uniref:Uncharacterized protein n=1 Tax=Anguilla anguilla TaxID=7936 RepID=A0A0E9QAV6_ANGAN
MRTELTDAHSIFQLRRPTISIAYIYI